MSFYRLFRCTVGVVPQTQSLLNKSRLPLGILIHPFKDLSVSRKLTFCIKVCEICSWPIEDRN